MLSTSCSSSTLPRASSKSPQHSPNNADFVLATALYDNAAETGDELAFMKGDILKVLEKNYLGQVGWWLCSLRGKMGICPGNRLRLMGHVVRSSPPSPVDSSPNKHLDKSYDSTDAVTLKSEMENSFYDVPNGHIGLLKGGSQCTYDVPSPIPLYDVPKQHQSRIQSNTDKDCQQMYDIPTPLAIYDVPVSALQKHSTSCPPSPLGNSGSGGEDLSPKQLYDVPRQVATTPNKNFSLVESVYDVPPQVTRDAPTPSSASPATFGQQQLVSPAARLNWSSTTESSEPGEPIRPMSGSELPLELSAAMDMLVKFQQEVQATTHRLFALVKTSPNAYDLQTACFDVRRALRDFLDFAKGALANLVRREDSAVCTRLNKLCRPLTDASNIVVETCDAMEKHLWAVTPDNSAQNQVDRLVACARTVVEDVRQVACFIQGNSTLIFKRKSTERTPTVAERPLPPPPVQEIPISENPPTENSASWITEDYDYVNLEPKESHQRNENDNQIIGFYSKQLEHLSLHLDQAIAQFLTTVENNQPPKVFVDYGKAVILVAHKLMFIGDSVHRHVFQEEWKKSVQRISDELCEALKMMVQRIKMAALQFPSVAAVQHMVDSVVVVSQAARKLKATVTSYAK